MTWLEFLVFGCDLKKCESGKACCNRCYRVLPKSAFDLKTNGQVQALCRECAASGRKF